MEDERKNCLLLRPTAKFGQFCCLSVHKVLALTIWQIWGKKTLTAIRWSRLLMVLNRHTGLPHPEAIKAGKKVCLKSLRTDYRGTGGLPIIGIVCIILNCSVHFFFLTNHSWIQRSSFFFLNSSSTKESPKENWRLYKGNIEAKKIISIRTGHTIKLGRQLRQTMECENINQIKAKLSGDFVSWIPISLWPPATQSNITCLSKLQSKAPVNY